MIGRELDSKIRSKRCHEELVVKVFGGDPGHED